MPDRKSCQTKTRLTMKIVPLKIASAALAAASGLLYFGMIPPTQAAGGVPVTTSTATPPPCTGSCKKVNPDVISMTDLPAGEPPETHLPSVAIYAAKTRLVISGIVVFPNEVDIALTARRGKRETVHLPFTGSPGPVPTFPHKALIDAVIEMTKYARVLYRTGTSGNVNTVSVSPIITVSQPVFVTIP
jgi:hypothetical protein